MAYFIDGKDCMISEWFMLTLATLCVAAHAYTQMFCVRKKLGLYEILLIASALDGFGLIICDTLTFQMGVLDHYEASETLSKISFASNYFYDFGMGLPKLSLLVFYWTSFDFKCHHRIRRMLWIITAFVIACYLTSLFDDTFFCGQDVSVQWSQEEDACSVFYAQEPFILNFTLGLTCYLAVYMIPVILLYHGIFQASTAVLLTFAAGVLPIASGIVRFICLKVGTGQENLV
ncbi:hypothetical protein PMIN04_013027, partial [Paraphaeosphaeria minitans]